MTRFDRKYLGIVVTANNYLDIKYSKPTKDFPFGGRLALKFHAKHLKTYLRGEKTFTHGFKINEFGNKEALIHKVQAELTEIPIEI